MENCVKIYDNSNFLNNLFDRLEVTNGIELAMGYDVYNVRKYKNGALKPKNNWRPLTSNEKSLLLTKETALATNSNIGLVGIPHNLIEKLKEIGFQDIANFEQFSNLFRNKNKQLEEATVLIGEFFQDLIKEDHSISEAKLLCVSYENPNIETIAYDQKTDEYFGLHFDSSIGNKLFERKNNPNRLSINIGNEPRYLLFVNLEIEKMFAMITEKDKDFSKQKNTLRDDELVFKFFEHYPEYPVLRLKQNPYEAYIAPTDNVVHDGSTVGKKEPDMTMVFTGYFKVNIN